MAPLDVATAAWSALQHLGSRVTSEVADRALDEALGSPSWREPRALDREPIIKACASLVHAASEARLVSFANQVAPLGKPDQRSHDYDDLLTLLWEISRRSTKAKDIVATTLFPESGAAPASLMQLAKLLGKTLRTPDELNGFAVRFAERIRRQVTLLGKDQAGPPTDGFGTLTMVDGEQQVVVQLSNFGPSFEGLLAYGQVLSEPSLVALMDAMVEMIASPHNLLANKTELAHYAGRFSEFLPSADADVLVRALSPLAEGQASDVTADTSWQCRRSIEPVQVQSRDSCPSAGYGADCFGAARQVPARCANSHHSRPGRGWFGTYGCVCSTRFVYRCELAVGHLRCDRDRAACRFARRQCGGRRCGTAGSCVIRTCAARRTSDGLSDSSRSSRISEQNRCSSFSSGRSGASTAQEKPHRISHPRAWRNRQASGKRSSVLGAINARATRRQLAWCAFTVRCEENTQRSEVPATWRHARERLPVGAGIEHAVVRAHVVLCGRRQRPGAVPWPPGAGTPPRNLQPRLTPEAMRPVGAHHVVLPVSARSGFRRYP